MTRARLKAVEEVEFCCQDARSFYVEHSAGRVIEVDPSVRYSGINMCRNCGHNESRIGIKVLNEPRFSAAHIEHIDIDEGS